MALFHLQEKNWIGTSGIMSPITVWTVEFQSNVFPSDKYNFAVTSLLLQEVSTLMIIHGKGRKKKLSWQSHYGIIHF